jgi:O-antigen/teichoic acid export membrane protein
MPSMHGTSSETDSPRSRAENAPGGADADPAVATRIEKPTEPAAPIGHLAIRGMIWQMGQILGAKCVTIIQQLLIAKYFLNDEDFGLLAVSQVVISIASLGQSLGVGEILVRRHRRFGKWVDAGFWLNLTGGIVGMLLVLGLIPIWKPAFLGVSQVFGGHVKEAPAIGGLLAIWALWLPLDAMTQIFFARLRADMRFRVMAVLGFVQVAGLAVLGIGLAWLGLKAYAMVVPIPILSLNTLIVSWVLSRQRIRWHLDLRRWRLFLKDSRFFLLGSVFNTLLLQGDYMLTSVFFERALLGAYYYAYRMSTQTIQLVSGNVLSVMLTSFSKIDQDEERRTIAYERTCAALLLAGMPLCFLQALLAEPVFHLIFQHKWDAALPLFEVLSIGMGFTLPMSAATSLLLAQGRYRLNVAWQGAMAFGFLLFVLMGALSGTVQHVAYAVCAFFVICGPIMTILPLRHVSNAKFLWRVYGFPVVTSVAAAGIGWCLSQAMPGPGEVASIAWRGLGWMGTLGLALWVIRPPATKELASRLRGLMPALAAGRP